MESRFKFLNSKTSVIGAFAVLTILLMLPLTLLLSQQKEDIRGKAATGATPRPLPPSKELGSISGYVYLDKNKDGEREWGEKPYEGLTIRITLLKNSEKAKEDDPTTDVKTDINGFFKYRFSNILPDSLNYVVKVVLPEGYRTINSNPIVFSGLHKDAKELIEVGVFPLDDFPTQIKSCSQRPACLDTAPRCLMPEPTEGWCPKQATQPSQPIKPTAKPTTKPTGKPTPTLTCVPRPACLSADPACQLAEPENGWCNSHSSSSSGSIKFGD